jgi:hypothetical protein
MPAKVLLGRIIDLWVDGWGCTMKDETLGTEIGRSQRSARRYRKRLYEHGYLAEKSRDGDRLLVPIRPDRSGHPATSDRTDLDNSASSDRTDLDTPARSGHQGAARSGQHRDHNPAEAGERRAQAREESSSGGSRWDFLPDRYAGYRSQIKAEAPPPGEPIDHLSIVARRSGIDESDLSTALVDGHREHHLHDEVLAAYVIAADKADGDPIAYAGEILRGGWADTRPSGSDRPTRTSPGYGSGCKNLAAQLHGDGSAGQPPEVSADA